MLLNPEQEDALKELLNIGVGRAAGALNQILDKPISLQIPNIMLSQTSELHHELAQFDDHTLSTVQLPFSGSYSGVATLAFPAEAAPKLVKILTGQTTEDDELNAMKVATLTEIGNIVLNGIMGSIANVLTETMSYSVPTYQETRATHLIQITPQEDDPSIVLWAQTRFTVHEYDISGDIFLMFKSNCLDTILSSINSLMGVKA